MPQPWPLSLTTVSPQISLTSGSFLTNPLHPRPSTTPVLFTPEQCGQPVPVTLPPSNNSVLLSVCHASAAQEAYNSMCDTWSLSLLGLCFTSSHLTQPRPGEAVPAVGKSPDLSSASSNLQQMLSHWTVVIMGNTGRPSLPVTPSLPASNQGQTLGTM
ncbi:hypothetical protein BC826DRAFT_968707 [Russula brevipes]|nr:hypothetical protein BC826DRAFT_968707 [Russula brevipes]